MLKIKQILDTEIVFEYLGKITVKGSLIFREKDSCMMQKLVFLVNISVIAEIVDVVNVVRGKYVFESVFCCGNDKFDIKKCYRDLGVIVFMTVWALVGNYAYNGSSEGYSHFFNWFFVVRDPFYAISEAIAPFVMPFLNIAQPILS